MCGSAARTDLYGGQLAIAVPTVTGISPNDSEALTVVENCKALAKHSEIEPPFSGQRTCARPLIRKNSARPRKGPGNA